MIERFVLKVGLAAVVVAIGGACTGKIGDQGGGGALDRSGGGAVVGGAGVGGPGLIDDPRAPMAQPCMPGNPPPTTRFFRLTHAQYDNSVRALTGLTLQPSIDFPADQNQAGFDRGV